MKKQLFVTSIFCFIAAYLPLAANAEDAIVTSVSVNPASTEAGKDTVHEIGFTSESNLDVGKSIYFMYWDSGNGKTADFNCNPGAFSDPTFSADLTCEDDIFVVTMTKALLPGGYSFDLEITNAESASTYALEVSTVTEEDHASFDDSTRSVSFVLTGEGDDTSDSNAISAVTFASDSTVAGAAAQYTINVTLDRAIMKGEKLYLIPIGDNTLSDVTGVDLSNATADNAEGNLDGALTCGSSDTKYIYSCGAIDGIPVGTYDIILSNVLNPTVPDTYYMQATTEELGEGVKFAVSASTVVISELTKPGKIKKSKMKVKNKKKRTAKLWVKAKSTATKYQFVLAKKKAKKKGYTQVVKFKNVKNNYKRLKQKYLKKGTQYRFKARAGNDAGWGKWSKWKKFKTKK